MTVIERNPSRVETRRYTHEELQTHLGHDYREKVRDFFVVSGVVDSDHQLPWKHHSDKDYTHPFSQANYLLWEVVNEDKDIIIISVLPPYSSTSPEHSHPGNEEGDEYQVIERYQCLFGEYVLERNGDKIPMGVGDVQEVRPGIKHRVRTPNDSWALLYIFIKNGGLYSPDQLHRH